MRYRIRTFGVVVFHHLRFHESVHQRQGVGPDWTHDFGPVWRGCGLFGASAGRGGEAALPGRAGVVLVQFRILDPEQVWRRNDPRIISRLEHHHNAGDSVHCDSVPVVRMVEVPVVGVREERKFIATQGSHLRVRCRGRCGRTHDAVGCN